MIECFAAFVAFVAIAIPVVVLLAWRDRRRYLKSENARPIEERIKEIRDSAAAEIEHLQELLTFA
jgi:hypothetical protein